MANEFNLETKLGEVVESGLKKHGAAFNSAADVYVSSAKDADEALRFRMEAARRGPEFVMQKAGEILSTRAAVAKRTKDNFNVYEHGSDRELDLHMKALAEKRRR
jgi:hypothetical protein